VRSPNIADWPDVYERENAAILADGRLLAAMRRQAPWAGRVLLDLDCGTGFWLPHYAADAGVGDRGRTRACAAGARDAARGACHRRRAGLEVLAGSAEHIPLPDASIDVVHPRFVYFFPPGGSAGLTEAMRVLRPGGTLVVVDNDLTWGDFASLVRRSPRAAAQGGHRTTRRWWARHGAERVTVRGSWACASAAELQAVLGIELPAELVDTWSPGILLPGA